MISQSIFVEERITWEEFNIYGADAAEASSDSQDGTNESPRYYKSLNRINALTILYFKFIVDTYCIKYCLYYNLFQKTPSR